MIKWAYIFDREGEVLWKYWFCFTFFFVFNTLSPNPEVMNDDMKEMLSKIDFLKDIYDLPKEIVLWTLDGDTVRKKFSNITFSWSIISPHSLFLPEIDLLSQEGSYRLVKKYAHTLYEKIWDTTFFSSHPYSLWKYLYEKSLRKDSSIFLPALAMVF